MRRTGRAVDVQATETRALDEHIKNLPKGQMQILMTDDTRGTLHAHLHVRSPADVRVPHFEPALLSSAKTVARKHRWAPICALRVPNSRRSDSQDACAENNEYEASNL